MQNMSIIHHIYRKAFGKVLRVGLIPWSLWKRKRKNRKMRSGKYEKKKKTGEKGERKIQPARINSGNFTLTE